MKSIPRNDLDKKFFHAEALSPKSANQRSASKTSLLAQLANNLSISALAAHSPLFSFCLSFCLRFLSHPTPPPLCSWRTTKGSILSFHSRPLLEALGLYTWEVNVQ